MKQRDKVIVLLFFAALAGSLWGVHEWGMELKRQAKERWL
jgi:hypothetical protein